MTIAEDMLEKWESGDYTNTHILQECEDMTGTVDIYLPRDRRAQTRIVLLLSDGSAILYTDDPYHPNIEERSSIKILEVIK